MTRCSDRRTRIRDYLGGLVRGSVEDSLNALRDAEADRLCNAGHYECTQIRRDTVTYSIVQAGHI